MTHPVYLHNGTFDEISQSFHNCKQVEKTRQMEEVRSFLILADCNHLTSFFLKAYTNFKVQTVVKFVEKYHCAVDLSCVLPK